MADQNLASSWSMASLRLPHQSQGTKSFIVLVASGRRQTIGRYPILSLAQARLQAKRILAAKTLGKVALPSISVQDALAIFFANSEKRHKFRTARDYKRLLLRHLATLMVTELDAVTTRDIAHITDRMRIRRPKPRTRSSRSRYFSIGVFAGATWRPTLANGCQRPSLRLASGS